MGLNYHTMIKLDICLLNWSNLSIFHWHCLIEWKWPRPWKIVYWATNLCPFILPLMPWKEVELDQCPITVGSLKPHIQWSIHCTQSMFNICWKGASLINPINMWRVGVQRQWNNSGFASHYEVLKANLFKVLFRV